MTILEIPLHAIDRGERAREDLGDIDSLALSIQAQGLLQPIVVRPKGTQAEHRFDLVAGGRRLAAVEQLGGMTIPATVREVDDAHARLLEAVENGERKAFTPVEAVRLGRRIEDDIKAGNLPRGDGRLTEVAAKAVGLSDRTYRKARDIVTYTPTTAAGERIHARLLSRLEAAGKVDGVHHQWAGLSFLEEHADHELPNVARMAAKVLDTAADDVTVDLFDERVGVAAFLQQEQEYLAPPAAVDDEVPGDPGPGAADPTDSPSVDEHGAVEGGAGEPTAPAPTPDDEWDPVAVWESLTEPQKVALIALGHADRDRVECHYSNKTSSLSAGERTVHHRHADSFGEMDPPLARTWVPVGGTFDDRLVALTEEGYNVLVRAGQYPSSAAEADDEWWQVQRRALSGLASDWEILEGWPTPTRDETTETVLHRGGHHFRALIISRTRSNLSPIFSTEAAAQAWLDETMGRTEPEAGPIPGEEPPAPEVVDDPADGVNAPSGTPGEGGSPALTDGADASTSPSEGSADPPAATPAEEGAGSRHPAPSSTTPDRRREAPRRPVPTSDFVQLAHHLAAAASIAREHPAAEVERVLAAYATPADLIDRIQSAAEVLPGYLADLRILAKPPQG